MARGSIFVKLDNENDVRGQDSADSEIACDHDRGRGIMRPHVLLLGKVVRELCFFGKLVRVAVVAVREV